MISCNLTMIVFYAVFKLFKCADSGTASQKAPILCIPPIPKQDSINALVAPFKVINDEL